MTKVTSSYICPYCGYILQNGDIDRCPNCFNSFSCSECLLPEIVEIKKQNKEEMYLNHGDVSNEIETRLGLYDPETGEEIMSDNTTFKVVFDETDKNYLKVVIAKEPID